MIDIKTAVKSPITFSYYRDSELWYKTGAGDLFPVPVSDIGNATFLTED